MDFAEAISLVPTWDAQEVQGFEMAGGMSNRLFKVRTNEAVFVLRIGGGDGPAGRASRQIELRVHEEAAAAGLAPNVIFSDLEQGILVTEFIDTPVWQETDLAERANLECLAALLRKVHALPEIGVTFDASAAASAYVKELRDDREFHEFARVCLDVIRSTEDAEPSRCCHNDIVAANILGFATPRLIDWEYACDNNPLFDLASLICYHDLDSDRVSILLQAYCGGEDQSTALHQQIRLFDALQWLWLACRQSAIASDVQAIRLRTLQERISE